MSQEQETANINAGIRYELRLRAWADLEDQHVECCVVPLTLGDIQSLIARIDQLRELRRADEYVEALQIRDTAPTWHALDHDAEEFPNPGTRTAEGALIAYGDLETEIVPKPYGEDGPGAIRSDDGPASFWTYCDRCEIDADAVRWTAVVKYGDWNIWSDIVTRSSLVKLLDWQTVEAAGTPDPNDHPKTGGRT